MNAAEAQQRIEIEQQAARVANATQFDQVVYRVGSGYAILSASEPVPDGGEEILRAYHDPFGGALFWRLP